MVKLIFCLRKRADLSHEEFFRYWKEQHGPMALKQRIPNLKLYIQNHTIQHPINDGLRESRGTLAPFDGIAEGHWESLDDLIAAFGTADGAELGRILIEDEVRFIDLAQSSVFIVEEYMMFDAAQAGQG